MLHYKVVEVSTVDEGSLEHAVNLWVRQGWTLEAVQFAMRESSKRPAMAFVFFTRARSGRGSGGAGRSLPGADGGRLEPAGGAGRRGRGFMSPLRAPFGGPNLQLVPEDGVPESPYPRCSLLLRGMARLADVGVAWVLALAAGRAGLVVAVLYLLLADGIVRGQSVGKRIFGVKVVFLPMRTDARFRDSTLRNAPLALIVLLRMMPEPLGLRAGLAGLVVIAGIEAWKAVRDPLGRRLGDVWAQTQVVDGKVVSGSQALARAQGVPVGPERWMNGTADRSDSSGGR